jgi:hypothetical protein
MDALGKVGEHLPRVVRLDPGEITKAPTPLRPSN